MRKLPVVFLGSLLFAPLASASSVSWGSYQTLFSQELEGDRIYDFKASYVSGSLSLRQNVTYSLSYHGGRIRIGNKAATAGCATGKLRAGDRLKFLGVRQVELHIPSRGCAGR
ncbi:hypothetical protein [Deinococcus sp.]|uniref:hypothetical protein n=1 Tax=Deinococcus sp. TaxID=47478 RepID=UPI003B5CF1E8